MLKILLHRRGPALWPELFSWKMLLKLLRQLGTALFHTVYQGEPLPEGGALFHAEWLRDYDALPPLLEVGQAWDTALKGGSEHDYSCGVTGGRDRDGIIYLLDLWRGQVETPALARQMAALAARWHPHWVLVEDAGAGAALLPHLRARHRLPVIPVSPRDGKLARAAAVTPVVEGGQVRLPAQVSWKEDFLAELLAFPNGRHDDQVDAFVYLVCRLARHGDVLAPSEWHTLKQPSDW